MENTKYYHGLAGSIPFWDSKQVLITSIKTLKLIFDLGGIYSRNELKKFGINYEEKEPIYNGDDYISVCIKNPSDDEFTGINLGLDSAYFRYVKYKIGIELKSDIIKTCIFREGPYKHLPGERQIYKFVDISNISRILVGILGEQNQVLEQIKQICKPYNIPVMTVEEAEYLEGKQKRL